MEQKRPLNPAHLAEIKARIITAAPYMQLLNMQAKDLDYGLCTLEVPLEGKHLHNYGSIHGGVYASIIDTAAYWACYCEMAEDQGFASIDLAVSNLAPVKGGVLFVEAKSIDIGRSVLLAEAKVFSDTGKLLAHGTSKLITKPNLKAATQVVLDMGWEPLPPKFLD